jgi:hypothetical protein
MTFERLAPLAFVLALTCHPVEARAAQSSSESPPDGQAPEGGVDLFGLGIHQTERFRISGLFIAGWSHDGAQAQLGFEKQARVGQATLTLSGKVNDRVRYLVSINPVNEVSSKPACGEANFFFPNDPRFYAAGPIVPCDPENGHKRVDTYNTFALDYVTQQGPLREGYLDWRIGRSMSMRAGRFVLPIGFAPSEVGSWTAKDLTRIQRLNAEANFGILLAHALNRRDGQPLVSAAFMTVLGDGNREKDYDWFYFANSSLDSNSAITAVATVRARPHPRADVRFAYKYGFTGSKVERLPSYWASKRHDRALVAGARVQVHRWASVFGELARYTWGPTITSAELLGVDRAPIAKPGYYFGGTFEVPVGRGLKTGMTLTREELSRDDSLVKYLATQDLYRIEMGKKDRGTIARFYVDVSRLVTIGGFWADVSNPYPWISGIWPVAGDRAYSGRDLRRYGLTVILRTP